MARKPALKKDPCGARLRGPTDSFDRYRVTWPDPVTGKISTVTHHDLESADAAYEQAVAYVTAAGSPAGAKRDGRRRTEVTVDDLFEMVLERWKLKGRAYSYTNSRKGVYTTWVQPVCGHLTVREWGSTDEYCLRVMASARKAGRAPATLQNIGALMRFIVSVAHKRKVLDTSWDPMDDVVYVSRSLSDKESTTYVPPTARPETVMVRNLADEFGNQGATDGRGWLDLMPKIGGFGGLRTGELLALWPEDVFYDGRVLTVGVNRAWTDAEDGGYELGPPKGKRRRTVRLPRSLAEDLTRRAAEVAKAHGPQALLFPGPKGPTEPFTQDELRRLFEKCARRAGWECTPDRRDKNGKLVKGHPVIPWRNLRHHAATWMNEELGLPWILVSRTLGHATLSFTLDRYVRPGADSDELQADAYYDH